MRASVLLAAPLAGCLLGTDPLGGAANVPQLDGAIRLVEPTPAAPGDAVHARQGQRVVVDIPTEAPIDPEASTVALDGFAMTFVDEVAPLVWRFERVLEGNEGSAPKAVLGVLRDARGADTPFASGVLLLTDFQPPTAACVLDPRIASAGSTITLGVTPSEPLRNGRPTVREDSGLLTVTWQAEVEGQHRFVVTAPPNTNLDGYTLTVEAEDRAGNPQVGDSLCDAVARTGSVLGLGPRLREGEDLTLEATPAVQVAGIPWVREGAALRVTVPTVDAIDVARSTLSLGGLALTHERGATWAVQLSGTEGDGRKDLDGWLVDAAGNTLRLQRQEVVRFDFTAPTADCILAPRIARASDTLRLEVLASEPLAGEGPTLVLDPASLVPSPQGAQGTTYSFHILPPPNTDVPSYVATLTATDLVGNPQEGTSLCPEASRQGEVRGVLPALDGEPTLDVTPSVPDQEGTPRARAGAELSLRLPTVAPLDRARSRVTLGGIELIPDPQDPHRWFHVLEGTEGDGLRSLDATLVDPAGNTTRVTRPEIAFLADFTPPRPVGAALERLPTFAPSSSGSVVVFTERDAATGDAVSGRLTLTPDEPVVWASAVTATGVGVASWDPEDVSPRSVRYALTDVASTLAEGTYVLEVALEDEVGNRSEPALLDVLLVSDVTGPTTSPLVNTPGTVSARRAPWGSRVGAAGLPFQEVVGAPGAVEPGATVLIWTERGTFPVGQVEAGPDGAFGPIDVPSEIAALWLEQLDPAGNPSPRARVRDVTWIASVRGRQPGNEASNPNVLREVGEGPWGSAPERAREPGAAALAALGGPAASIEGPLTLGAGWWEPLDPGAERPLWTEDRRLAADPARGELVLFGGTDAAGGGTDDTWLWRSHAWAPGALRGQRPPPRWAAGLTWDPARQQLLLTHGSGAGLYDDTWAWDGTVWTEVTPEGDRPPPRQYPAVGTDEARGEVVLFSGWDGRRLLRDTWIWNGTAWRLAPATPGGPGPTFDGVIFPDPLTGEPILVHGTQGNEGTWRWLGDRWSLVAPPEDTPYLPAPTAATDRRGGRSLVVAGDGVGNLAAWWWNGTAWSAGPSSFPGEGFSVRPVAYEAAHDRFVMVTEDPDSDRTLTWALEQDVWTLADGPGGELTKRTGAATAQEASGAPWVLGGYLLDNTAGGAVVVRDDAQVWSRSRWLPRPPIPGPRAFAAATLDQNTGEVLVAGGSDAANVDVFTYDDAWVQSGQGWTEVVALGAGPAPLTGHRLAWSPELSAPVLYGGDAPATSNRLLRWTGTGWADLGVSPAGRRNGHLQITDDARAAIVVHGGADASYNARYDTWVWDASGWRQASGTAPQPLRVQPAGGYDPLRREVLLFGGLLDSGAALADLWRFTGETWEAVELRGPRPTPRSDAVLLPDPATERMILELGFENTLGDWLEDPWAWSGGARERVGHLLEVAASRAGTTPATEVHALTAWWQAEGHGLQDEAHVGGVELRVWDLSHWRTVAQVPHDTSAGPVELCWTVRASASVPTSPGCAVTTDATLLERLVRRRQDGAIQLAVTPLAPNGWSVPRPGHAAPYGSLRTLDAEVEMVLRFEASVLP